MNFEKIIAERPTKTVYKDNDRTIKLFVENYSKSDILNEALNQARVEEVELNIPKLLEVTKIENRWALISEYVEGDTLEELMQKHPEKQEEYLKLFVETQCEILSKNSPLLSRVKDKMKRKITNADNINENIKYELLHRLESLPGGTSVCHGDFNPSNVIVREDGKVFVIDWSHVTQGSPVFDAARTYLLFSIASQNDIAEKYLSIFAEKSSIDRQEILRCVPIVAATELTKKKEDEREFLSRLIDVVDYI